MAVDKLVDSSQLDADLTSVANAIRAKGGTSAQLAFPAGFVSAVEAIEAGTSEEEAYLDRHFSTEDFESKRSFSIDGLRLGPSFAARSVRWLNATGGGYYTVQNFCSNSKVKYFVFPKVTDFSVDMFRNCTSLLGVEMSSVTTIRQTCFSGCTEFGLLVIRKNGVPTLSNISAFGNTKFASGKAGGILYVPQAQIANYQAATNWSTILGYSTNQILPIEGSIYETQYVDGTPIA